MTAKAIMPTPVTDVYEIPVSLIVADAKQNTRKTIQDIPELAKTIKSEGQQTPVLVAKRDDGKFDLIYGFRRFYAISWPTDAKEKEKQGLGWETIKARVVDAMEPGERLMTNLVENLAREDLSSYDTALACKMLEDSTKDAEKEKDRMNGQKIANRVGKSASYINNLLKAVRNLPPNIMLRWKEEQSAEWETKYPGTKRVLTTDNLNRLAKDNMTDEERQLEFKKLKGEDVGGGGGGGGTGAGAGGVKRASKAALEKALERAKEMQKAENAKKKPNAANAAGFNVAVSCLKFALGETESIKGIYEPEDDDDEDGN